jgi:hypothetical protein
VLAEGIRITPSTLGYLAGSRDAIRADIIKRLPERAREEFPGDGGVLVKPVPEKLPPYLIMVLLVCQSLFPTPPPISQVFR